MGRFKKGLFFGGLLGAGLMWLNGTTKGKQTRAQILKHAQEVYPDIKKKVLSSKAYNTMTKSKYLKIVEEHVSTYAKKYKLPPSVKNMIIKVVAANWKNIQSAIKKK